VTTYHSLSETLHFHDGMDSHMYSDGILGASAGGRCTLARITRTAGERERGAGRIVCIDL
jgi:hypothetical protein